MATWLQDAGYRTALVGKYLNRYVPKRAGVPPGWDDWYVGGNAHAATTMPSTRTVGRRLRRPARGLSERRPDRQGGPVIRHASTAAQPFFVYMPPFAPHSPSVAAPRHGGMFADCEPPRPPAFDEADVSDKPAFIRRIPPSMRASSAGSSASTGAAHSLQAIDDMVARIVERSGGRPRAREHLRDLQLRQRLPPGRAPPAGRQGFCL